MIKDKVLGSDVESVVVASSVQCEGGRGVWRVLYIVLLACPWLITTHNDPWTTFYSEWAMAVVLLPLLFWSLLVCKKKWAFDRLALVVACISIVPIFQSVFGVLVFKGDAVLYVILLLGFSCLVSLGQRSELVNSDKLVGVLFASFICAAVASTGLALYQWFGLTGLGILVPTMSVGGGRVVAALGQPNNLATFLMWGVVAVWWFWHKRILSGVVATFVAAFILVGVALTASRTGCLQVFILAISFLLLFSKFNYKGFRYPIVFLVLWYLLVLGFSQIFAEFFFEEAGRSFAGVGVRAKFWEMALRGIWEHPVLGYGWNQVVMLHVALADEYSGLGSVMGHSHNIIFDVLLWNGVLLGGGILIAAFIWGYTQLRTVRTTEHALLWIAVGVFFIHAMLELPHLYAFFTLPLALMIGCASAKGQVRAVVTVPKTLVAFVGIFFAVIIGCMFVDYSNIVKNLTAHRMVAAKITGAKVPSEPHVTFLVSLQDALNGLRAEPKKGMSLDALKRFRDTVERYPVSAGLYRYAKAAALNNNAPEAAWGLRVLCDLKAKHVCDTAIREWKEAAVTDPEMKGVTLPR
ncbi:PglL family O-oligosaccharyltransferase [Pseudomonas sp. M30-35]|uniref:PglL family O-oligosaccharyltransferase n=1 Tax=Pseudomonas sp. M30-35 TaxID=1981174 RepID=UPI000B3C6E67|nr:O-antigen ligase family protein [Pseudomonas sp. M30-35]ARU89781.1 hypothetical protein B9K09_18180 [Pseudomonas sp. M30-35]